MLIKKLLFTILILILSLSMTGCGALLSVLISALVGTKIGFVFIPIIVAAGREDDKKNGMILLSDNNPPDGYEPLAGATVAVGTIFTTTGSDGSFTLNNVPVGLKEMTVHHPDYNPIIQDVIIQDPNSTGITITDLKITPSQVIIPIGVGGAIEFDAYGVDNKGNPVVANVTWSLEGNIGTINDKGLFTSKKSGTGKVKAVSNDLSAEVTVTVVEATGKITGKVTSNGEPVVASVRVLDTPFLTNSDTNGNYTLPGIPATAVTLVAKRDNKSGSTTVIIPPNQTVEANIELLYQNPTPPVPTINTDIQFIEPNTGGTIIISDCTVEFPPQSVISKVAVNASIFKINFALPDSVKPIGNLYKITLSQPDVYNSNSATMKIKLPPGIEGKDISIYHSDGTSWTNLGGQFNEQEKFIYTNIPAFGYFILGAPVINKTPLPTPTRLPTVHVPIVVD